MQLFKYQLFKYIASAGFDICSGHTAQAETAETQVAVQDHVLIYDGPLSPEANARAAELLKQSDKIDTLKINSRGGEIGLGIDLGNLVYDHQLNVEVGQYCFFHLVPITCLLQAKSNI